MKIVDRIREIIEYKGISTRKFCIEIGVSNGFFNKVNDVGSEKVLKILNTYPEISPEWLLTGKGDMLSKTKCTQISAPHMPDTQIPRKDIEKKQHTQENSQIIDKFLQRLESQSEEIGRLKSEIASLRQQIEQNQAVLHIGETCSCAV